MLLRSLFFLSATGLFLAACEPAPLPPKFPEITFRTEAPLRLATNNIEISESYVPPLRAPNVEHESPLPPSILLRRWAEQRLVAAGGPGTVRATVTDASITETPIATNQDLEAAFETEQVARFEGRAAMRIEYVDPDGTVRATAEGAATQIRTLPEDATLRERREVLFQISEDLARGLDKVLAANIQQHFAPHLEP